MVTAGHGSTLGAGGVIVVGVAIAEAAGTLVVSMIWEGMGHRNVNINMVGMTTNATGMHSVVYMPRTSSLA